VGEGLLGLFVQGPSSHSLPKAGEQAGVLSNRRPVLGEDSGVGESA